ncbi:hypothetical protein BJ742DRAFT_349671 [Cladochytrium replicatum]|nr:hypothetical protein BJ742DRAFT_349671 [Cladochytrium replicatum]
MWFRLQTVFMQVIFKKLLKRDTITRVKALEEFHTYLNGDKTAQDFVQALSAWPKLFNKLSIDSDRRVRESTFLVHLTLVKGLPKRQAILPYLKDIIGSWICGKFDGSKEVVKYATESFEECFPNKRTEAFAFCQSEILRFCFENALNSTPETLSDPRFTSAEDMASKFGRVVSGCVAMMALLLGCLTFAPGKTF